MRARPRSRQSLGQNSSSRGTFWVWGANSGRHWGLELDQLQRVEGSVGLVGRSRPREQRWRSALYLETPEKVVEPPQPAQVGLGNRAEPAGEEDDRTLCPCLERPPTHHPSEPADRVQNRCRYVVPLGVERGPGWEYRGAAGPGVEQWMGWAAGSSWASLGGPQASPTGVAWQGPPLPCLGCKVHPESPRLCRQIGPWPVPSH